MTDDQLETHIKECLTALSERLTKDQAIRQRTSEIRKPQGPADTRRYINEWKAAYDEQNFQEMYERIETHGTAVLQLTNEPEITTRIENMLRLAGVERNDLQDLLSTLDNATNILGFTVLFVSLLAAAIRGRPRQSQLDQLTLDLTTYCLVRFPPSGEG